MNYTVYKHTAPDGRIYVGITSQKPAVRWQCGNGYKGNSYFTRAIQKYGWDNFSHEILFENISRDEAVKHEIELIARYKSNQRKFGFNISSGGESKSGTKISQRQKDLISAASKGRIVSEETRKKLSAASKRTWSNPEYVEHMREINSGEKNKMFGKKLSAEEKIKRKAKSVLQYSISGELIGSFISIHEANEKTGVNRNDLSKCCKGIFKQAGGYIWRYVCE